MGHDLFLVDMHQLCLLHQNIDKYNIDNMVHPHGDRLTPLKLGVLEFYVQLDVGLFLYI